MPDNRLLMTHNSAHYFRLLFSYDPLHLNGLACQQLRAIPLHLTTYPYHDKHHIEIGVANQVSKPGV